MSDEPTVQKKVVVLPIEQAQEILNFLTSCPYGQVFQLVAYLTAATLQNGDGDAGAV